MVEYKCDYCKEKIKIQDLVKLRFEPEVQGFIVQRQFEFHKSCAERLSIAIAKDKILL